MFLVICLELFALPVAVHHETFPLHQQLHLFSYLSTVKLFQVARFYYPK